MPACPKCGTQNPTEASFCMACASPLAQDVSPPRESRKTVTILFTDVVGSTDLGERVDPETLRRVMSRYFDLAKDVIHRHDGTVEKFIGDAVMAVFGVPVLHEDDALRAVRAAEELRRALADLNEELLAERAVAIATRTGINTGEVVAGDAAGERVVTGDAVNVAARLEQAAEPGEILIGDPTYRLTRDAVTVEPVPPLSVRGKAQPVPAWRLLEAAPEGEGFARRLESPMVGRDDELQLLGQSFRRAVRERACLLFTVIGSAGVGKSRLIREFVSSIEHQATVLRGRCLPYGDGITYWPLVEAVSEAAGLGEQLPSEETVGRIGSLLEGEDERDAIASRVAQAIGAAGGEAPAEEIAWAVRKLFECLARERALVLIFDDIQWGESTFIDLIDHVADWSRDASILLVCMARQELLDMRPAWGGGKLNATTIHLGPLTEKECEELIGNLLGRAELEDESRARIVETAEGNPLFVEQMLSMLIDDGLLRRADGRWIAVGELSALHVPPTIQALLAARLDRLDREERVVIECGSVEGKVFHRGAVTALVPERVRARVASHLMTLIRRDLIGPDRPEFRGEVAFRFRHQLIRDATYQSIPKEARGELHEGFAGWLYGVAGDRLGEYEEIVGYHLAEAWRYAIELGRSDERTAELAREASALLSAAGRRAQARGDAPAAAKLLERAVGLIPETDAERAYLAVLLAQALADRGELGRAEEVMADAARLPIVAGDEGRRLFVDIHHLSARMRVDPEGLAEEAERLSRLAVERLEEFNDHRGLAAAWNLMAEALNYWAQRAGMSEALERAIEHASLAGDRRMETELAGYLASNLYWGPTPVDEGLGRIEELLPRARGNRVIEARMLHFKAGFEGMQGRFEEARALIERVRGVFQDLGNRLYLATLGFLVGPLELWAGDPVAAERELRANCEELQRMGEKTWLCSLAAFLAEALYVQGRDDEAEYWVGVARETAASDDLEAQSDWRAVQAKILARRGFHEEADFLVREAVTIAEKTDEIDHVADVWMDLGEVLRLGGKPSEAASAFRIAAGWYERKGNRVMTKRARDQAAAITDDR